LERNDTENDNTMNFQPFKEALNKNSKERKIDNNSIGVDFSFEERESKEEERV